MLVSTSVILYEVLIMAIVRSKMNPIIKPEDVKPSRPGFEVICAFNAGVARLEKEVILLLRVAERPITQNPDKYLCPMLDGENNLIVKEFNTKDETCDFSDSRVIKTSNGNYLTSMSHFRVARSFDGVNFDIDESPSIFPENQYEAFGIEDPRITFIDGIYYINYSAISHIGITTCLIATKDFKTFERLGVILHPDNKDVEIFPGKINGKYYALHRPSISHFGKPDIWLAESSDLLCWGNHRYLMGVREGYWDNGRIGGSAIPFKVDGGWLEIYHGATKDDRYCLGAVLLDENEPWKIIARTETPIMEPEADYEINGFFGNVIFTCGVLYEEEIVKVYYGAADTYLCYAEIAVSEILTRLKKVG